MVSNCTRHFLSERSVEAWQIHSVRSNSVRVKVSILIVGAMSHHFRSYLEAEPDVQAEVAMYQAMRTPEGTFVEFTSRISNKLREMESGF